MNYRECLFNKFRFLLITALCAFVLSSCSSQAKQKHLERGEDYLQKRKYYEAVMEFRAAAEIDKNSGDAFWGLSRAQENLGDFTQTIENLRKNGRIGFNKSGSKSKTWELFFGF